MKPFRAIGGKVIKFDSIEACVSMSKGEPLYQHKDGTYSLSPDEPEPRATMVSTVTAVDHKNKTVTFDT